MGKKQERGREPESRAENGIERKGGDQKVKRSRSQTEQGAQLSDASKGEEERRGGAQRGKGGGRATGEEGRSTEREKEGGEQPADRAGSRDEESREAGEQGRGRGGTLPPYPPSLTSLPFLPASCKHSRWRRPAKAQGGATCLPRLFSLSDK